MKSTHRCRPAVVAGVLLLLTSAASQAFAAPVYRFVVHGSWSGGDPTLIGSALGKPFQWEFLFDQGESPTEDFRNDAANVPPEAQYTYAADGKTRTLFLDADASSDAEPLLARTPAAALKLQLTNDLTEFPPFGTIPPSDLGSWIDSVVTTAGPKDIRLDTPLELGYQNSFIDAALSPPTDVLDLVALFTEAAAGGTPHVASVTGLGGILLDPTGPVTSIEYQLVPEPSVWLSCAMLFVCLLARRYASSLR